MSATILPFKGKPQEPEVFSRNDVKVMLVLGADLIADEWYAVAGVDKDLDLYNDIQDYISELEIPDQLTRAELHHVLDHIIDEFESYADVSSMFKMVKDDMNSLRPDTKKMVLQAFGQQLAQALHLPEIHGDLPDGPGF